MKIVHYWTLSKVGGTPQDVRRYHGVNNQDLAPEVAQVFRTKLDLINSFWFLSIVRGPAVHGQPEEWECVVVDADGEQEIIPDGSLGIEGLFVKNIGEISRQGMSEWLTEALNSDDAELALEAKSRQRTIRRRAKKG